MEKELSIYVHIPFCNSKCFYCSFCSSKESLTTQKSFFKAINKEINEKSKNFSNYVVKTIYFGGGTPSATDGKSISKLLQNIKNKFSVSKDAEITIELNPNSTTKEKLEGYKKAGFNRLSFGVQTFNKKSLLFVGRLQTKEQAKQYKKQVVSCLKLAKEIGFKNISADFILGLPFQRTCEIQKFLKQLSKFVTHFSCYMLQLEEGTKLFSVLNGKNNDELILKQYNCAIKTLKKLGFNQYEISNFSLQNYESKHNLVYWNRGEYVGFGPSASSFYKGTRKTNKNDLKNYILFWNNSEINLKNEPKISEKLTKNEQAEETILLSLRTQKGLDLGQFSEKYFNFEEKNQKIIKKLINLNLIKIENGFLKLTSKGILVENSIILELIKEIN